MSATAIAPPLRTPPDRVRLINRSVRCLIFGLVGVIPCFGLGMVWLAFQLFRDIAAETGEPVKLYPLCLISLSGVCLAVVCCAYDLPNGFLADAIIVLGLQLLFLRRQYLSNAPSEWNPARLHMYWGLGLANLGLLFSTLLVALVCYAVTHD